MLFIYGGNKMFLQSMTILWLIPQALWEQNLMGLLPVASSEW